MISAISTAPVLPRRPDVNFATIDTAETAALLPAFNLAAIEPVWSGVFAQVMGGKHAGPMTMDIALGDHTSGQVTYQLVESPDHQMALRGSGALGGVSFDETWTISPQGGVHVSGKIGDTTEDLTETPDPQTRIAKVDGSVGKLPVHLLVRGTDGGGMDAAGTIGGTSFSQTMEASDKALAIHGNVGSKPIAATITGAQAPDGAFAFHSEGNIAGTAFKIDTRLPA